METSTLTTSILDGDELPIMENFYTIQGEGFHTGKAAYFIRIGGCDVGCHWCDVKESWDAKLHPLTKITDILTSAIQYPAKSVVITGGEPTQYKLTHLTELFRQHGYKTFLETSGAYAISGKWDWICLSPKKTMPPLHENLLLAGELKVIIHNRDDFRWAEQHKKLVSGECKLYLQPEWSKSKELMPIITEYVMNHPEWEISLQTHKYMNIP